MDIKRLQKLAERENARKTTTNLGGRPTSGKFYTKDNFPDWCWALVKIGRIDAEILSSTAKSHGLSETKFSATLIENHLHEIIGKRELDAPEVIASGLQFSDPGRSRESVWLEIRITKDLARTARDLKRRDPHLRDLTDYQLLSALLNRAVSDFLQSTEIHPFALDATPEPITTDTLNSVEIKTDDIPNQPEPVITETNNSIDAIIEPLGTGESAEIQPAEQSQEPAPAAPPKSSSRFPKFVKKAFEEKRNNNLEL